MTYHGSRPAVGVSVGRLIRTTINVAKVSQLPVSNIDHTVHKDEHIKGKDYYI